MTQHFHDGEQPLSVPSRPRLVLMGEFSSGKSTLSNILLGGQVLPTQVTATRLPPVLVSYGPPSATAIRRDGERYMVDLADLGGLTPEEFRALHVTMQSDLLELCDLVDMPGISDPNMPADTWDSVIGAQDHVIWCTHATQAWRQSEAAMWDRLRLATSGRNLLLVTQIDKIHNPRDRARVLGRVASETAGKFSAVYPVALLEALKAGDDPSRWLSSGAQQLIEDLIEMLVQQEDPAPVVAQDVPFEAREPEPSAAPPAVAPPQAAEGIVVSMPRQRRQTAIAKAPGADREKGTVRPRRVQGRQGKPGPARGLTITRDHTSHMAPEAP